MDSIYSNRNTLSGGGNHGFELWRSLFIQHEGGADQVELGGMGSLHNFHNVMWLKLFSIGMANGKR